MIGFYGVFFGGDQEYIATIISAVKGSLVPVNFPGVGPCH
jgi:hypothetical protein